MEELGVEISESPNLVAEDRKHLLFLGSCNPGRVQERWLSFANAMAGAMYLPRLEDSSPLKANWLLVPLHMGLFSKQLEFPHSMVAGFQ